MEEQNRKDPGGLKRHGDPMSGASDVERGSGAIGRPGEGESRGDRPGEEKGRGSPGQSAGAPSTTGGMGGARSPQRAGSAAGGYSTGMHEGESSMRGGGNRGGSGMGGGERASEPFGQALGGATAVADRVRSDVERVAETGMHRLAEEIRSLGAATHSAVDKLNEEERGEVAGYVDDVTRRVEDIADYLDRKGFDGLIRDASEMARRNPAVFLGAAAVAGFIIGRIVSAGSPGGGSQRRHGRAGSGHEKSLFEQAETERRPI